MGPLQQASLFLIQTIMGMYLLIVLLRLVLQYLRVDFYNPFTQFILKATNPLVIPLRRVIPGYWGIDMATVVVLVCLTLVKLILTMLISAGTFPSVGGLLIWTVGSLTDLTLTLYFYAIFLVVILSWVAPRSHSPMTNVLYSLTEPLMRPARRYIPPISGFDISPIAVIIILQLLTILIANPLIKMGAQLAAH